MSASSDPTKEIQTTTARCGDPFWPSADASRFQIRCFHRCFWCFHRCSRCLRYFHRRFHQRRRDEGYSFQKMRSAPNKETSYPIGGGNGGECSVTIEVHTSSKLNNARKISILPLVFIIFYEVSGGPFGVEDSVGAAGPLLSLLGLLLFPILWSVPEALITAEMGTMFPENGGFVVIWNAYYCFVYLNRNH